jgi:hypothetical protein
VIENWNFSKRKLQQNCVQGGYQLCSDTMLGNMASIDGGEKSL